MFYDLAKYLSASWWSFKYGWLLKASQTDKKSIGMFSWHTQTDIIDLPVYQFNYLLNHVMPNAPGALLVVDKGDPHILVNDILLDYQYEYQEALYLHEVGHICCMHITPTSPLLQTDPKKEIEADHYVKEHGRGNELAYMLEQIMQNIKLPFCADKRSFYTSMKMRIDLLRYIGK